MAGPLIGMLTQAGGAMFGQQIGQALAGLAGEVVSSTDIGLPLGPERTAAVLPAQRRRRSARGSSTPPPTSCSYVMLRECAHHRLFHHATVAARRARRRDRGVRPRHPHRRLGHRVADAGPRPVPPRGHRRRPCRAACSSPSARPSSSTRIERLETLLAFIEGWVDEVVGQATARRHAAPPPALAEAMRRRRAAGGPAEQTFASLVGLELRPRRLRDAATLWAALRDRQGAEARDAVWSHPDLMPTAADLDDPLGFAQDETGRSSDADFDAALGELLDGGRPGRRRHGLATTDE